MLDALVEAAFEAVVEVVITGTGSLLVAVLSFGFWRTESMLESSREPYAGTLWFRRKGGVVVTSLGASLVGFAFYAGLVGVLIYRAM